MHAAVLAALLTLGAAPAKPLVLFEGHADTWPEFDAAVKQALEAQGRQVREISAEAKAYREGPWAQAQFDGPIPANYPADAKADLEQGMAACKVLQGLPVSATNPGPRACAGELVEAVWERHLARQGAEAVLSFSWGGYHRLQMTLDGYKPGEATGRQLSVDGKPSTEMAVQLVERYLRGEGQVSPRSVPVLPEAPSAGDQLLLVGRYAALPPVPQPAGCKGLPRLVVGPLHLPLARVIQSRWQAGAAGAAPQGKPLLCRLTATPAASKAPARAQLACQESTFEVELPSALDKPETMDKVSAALIGKAMAYGCTHP